MDWYSWAKISEILSMCLELTLEMTTGAYPLRLPEIDSTLTEEAIFSFSTSLL